MGNTWIGTTNSLVNSGQPVIVTLSTGKTVTAKAIQRISSSKVGVFKSGNTYYAVNAGNVSEPQKIQSLSFSKSRGRLASGGNYSVAMLVKVKRPGLRINCNCNRGNRYNYIGGRCVQTCNGPYTSIEQCRQEHPDSEPWYSIGYFNPGYMQLLGGNNYHLGFFYPIEGGSIEHPYCFSGGMDTVDPSSYNTRDRSTITGDPNDLYEPMRKVLPFSSAYPYRFYYPYNDSFFLRHWGYIPSEVTASMITEWESLYLLELELYRNRLSEGQGSIPFNFENIPFEVNTPVLNLDGSIKTVPDPNAPGGRRQVFSWHGIPNWFWRQVNITAIAIENTFYYASGRGIPITNRLIFEQNYWRHRSSVGLAPDDFNAAQFQRLYANAGDLPASIITRTYRGSVRPSPPVAEPNISNWVLLWDTQTCPPVDNGDGGTYTYDTYTYYYYDGGDPIQLVSTRSDEDTVFFITNVDGLTTATIKYGVVTENERNEYCKATVYSSGEINVYTNPTEIPVNPLDWQSYLASSWSGVLPPTIDPGQNPCFSQYVGTWDLLNQRLFSHSRVLDNIVTYPNPNNPTQIIEAPLFRALVDTSLTVTVPVLDFAYATDEDGNQTCQLTELLEVEIDVPQVIIPGANTENVEVVGWSIWINP